MPSVVENRHRQIDCVVYFKVIGSFTLLKVPGADEVVVLHFVCFVERNGHIYELDGRKKSPINHGETSADKFLQVC